MEERNVIGGFMAAVMSNLLDFMEPLKWFLLLGFVLIVADLRFGRLAIRHTGGKGKGRENSHLAGNKENSEQDYRLLVLDTCCRRDGESVRDTV